MAMISVLSAAAAYRVRGSSFTSKNLIPQENGLSTSVAWSCAPRMKRAAAKASTVVRRKGRPKLTGFAARRKGSARRRFTGGLPAASSTFHEQSMAVMDRTGRSAGERAYSAVGSRRRVER